MVPEVRAALEALGRSLGGLLAHFVTRSGCLVDLSCMITDADCEFQPLHADTSLARVKYTVFIALQDVTAEMGPTWLCPQTHNPESHEAWEVLQHSGFPHDEVLQRFGALSAVCRIGTAVVMSSQLLHCGGQQAPANAGGRRRRLLYVTWHSPGNTPGEHSLRDDLVGEFQLSDFDGGPCLTRAKDEAYKRLFVAANKLSDNEAILEFGKLLRERGDRGALAWLKRASRRRNPVAVMLLAEIYCLGELGVEQSYQHADELRQYALSMLDYISKRPQSEESPEAEDVNPNEPEPPLCFRTM
eukprot:TRINITY_DN48990_c0_g1_i1.p1 TRINITY_DN48990_c0_g1~~TRINITY_DN48990_c0_g1_i1.p1  ORF type:complete len:300 (-),score=54.86 TRINITY_DN48990_c0_g1_i1:4-903(-)